MLLPTSVFSASSTSVLGSQKAITGDLFLKDLKSQLDVYTNNYIQDYNNITRQLGALLLTEIEDDNTRTKDVTRSHLRRRRQMMAPDIGALQSGYSQFFGSKNRRQYQTSKKKTTKTKKPPEDDMPIVLVPQEDETECVSNNQLSSFGFLGFILNVVNAVINVANNMNNNANSNNDNNNNNNNNDQNINQVAITETADNTNMAMAIAGRRIQRLQLMRSELRGHMRNVENYNARQRRSSSGDVSCGENDVVDESLLAAVALVDMWKEVLFEEDPFCMALEFCETSWKLNQVSRLAGMMAEVAGVAAANMLRNFQGVNPAYLIHAAEQGTHGANCTQLYLSCHHFNEV